MYKDKFVLSIIHDGRPVKETGGSYNRQVVIPFGSEYKIRLKNKNDRSCTARVTVDGVLVSNMGDIIVNAGGTVDIERFINDSLKNGKKFKFVSLDHSSVDDPTKSENGIVQVEFRLSKKQDDLKIRPPFDKWDIPYPYPPKFKEDNYGMRDSGWVYFPGPDCSAGNPNWGKSYTTSKNINNGTIVNYSCCSETGSTIEGSNSDQSFYYSNLDVESIPSAVLELKLVGLNKSSVENNRYCSQCGRKVKQRDKYCSACGNRL